MTREELDKIRQDFVDAATAAALTLAEVIDDTNYLAVTTNVAAAAKRSATWDKYNQALKEYHKLEE